MHFIQKRLVHSLTARQQKKNSSNWELLLISHSKEGNNLLLFYGTLFSLVDILVNYDCFYILRGSSCIEKKTVKNYQWIFKLKINWNFIESCYYQWFFSLLWKIQGRCKFNSNWSIRVEVSILLTNQRPVL